MTLTEGDVVIDVSSIEAGSLSSREGEQMGSVEEQTPSVTESEEGTVHFTLSNLPEHLFLRSKYISFLILFSVPEVSNEPIVAGMILLAEEQTHVMSVSAESEKIECINQQTNVSELTLKGYFHPKITSHLVTHMWFCEMQKWIFREMCICACVPPLYEQSTVSFFSYLFIITGGGALNTTAGATGITGRT